MNGLAARFTSCIADVTRSTFQGNASASSSERTAFSSLFAFRTLGFKPERVARSAWGMAFDGVRFSPENSPGPSSLIITSSKPAVNPVLRVRQKEALTAFWQVRDY